MRRHWHFDEIPIIDFKKSPKIYKFEAVSFNFIFLKR